MKHIKRDLPSKSQPLAKDIGYGQPFNYAGSIYIRTKCKSEKLRLNKESGYIAAVNLKIGNLRGIDRDATVSLANVAFCDIEGEWSLSDGNGRQGSCWFFEPKDNQRDEIDELIFTCNYKLNICTNGFDLTAIQIKKDHKCEIAEKIIRRLRG